jgi:hypothetical protein
MLVACLVLAAKNGLIVWKCALSSEKYEVLSNSE